MSDHAVKDTGLLSPRRIAVQLLGFLVGLALLAWCIRGAIAGGGWDKLAHANPLLIAAMLGCTCASAFINGSTFWITVQSLKPLHFWHMQWLNLVGNMLNYAPLRLGAIARVLYHLRVDALSLLQIGAWFAFIGYILTLGVAACLLATLVHDRIDWIWALIVLAQMALGGALTRTLVANKLLVQHGRGIDRVLADQRAVWGAIALRLVDLAAYVGRMAVAMQILDINLPTSHTVVLAIVALAASLIPFGRLGFREFCVALTARQLSMLAADVDANMQQLALVESAGEAVIFIPLGAIALLWYRHRWLHGRSTASPDPALRPR